MNLFLRARTWDKPISDRQPGSDLYSSVAEAEGVLSVYPG